MFEIIHLTKSESIPDDWLSDPEIHNDYFHRKDDSEHTFLVRARKDDKTIAFLMATIYKLGSMTRTDQWGFGANKDRLLWIDHIFSDVKGYGSKILNFFESYIKGFTFEGKQNIYLVSKDEVVVFYLKNGYTPVFLRHPEDEDYPEVYLTEIAKWMAKPLGDTLDGEVSDYNRNILNYKDLIYALDCLDYEAFERKFDTRKFVDEFPGLSKVLSKDNFSDAWECVNEAKDEQGIILHNPFDFEVDYDRIGATYTMLARHYYEDNCEWKKKK